jgi:hypothetical protein
MDHRSDDLFVVDAEQAVLELAQYGACTTELGLDRLTGFLEYFASLLHSIGLDAEADFSLDFARSIPTMDEGDGRRTARDFADLVQAQLVAIRQQQAGGDNREALERFRLRFAVIGSNEQVAQVQESKVIDHATRTIAAVDELAANLLRQVAQYETTRVELPKPITTTSPFVGDLSEASHADMPTALESSAELVRDTDEERSSEGSVDDSDQHESKPSAPFTLDDQGETLEDLGKLQPTSNDFQGLRERPSKHTVLQQEVELRKVARIGIDSVFAKALKLASHGTWPDGLSSLLESVDELDQVYFAEQLSPSFQLSGRSLAKANQHLARCVAAELLQTNQSPSIEITFVASTLLLSIFFEQPAKPDRMARLAAMFAGRLESSANNTHWRLVLPASSRLLRIMPLKLHGNWVAASWAQYVDMQQDQNRRIEVKLSFGDVPDRMIVDELGLVTVAVRFDLPDLLRKRDRFRGVVMLSSGQVLPLLG